MAEAFASAALMEVVALCSVLAESWRVAILMPETKRSRDSAPSAPKVWARALAGAKAAIRPARVRPLKRVI